MCQLECHHVREHAATARRSRYRAGGGVLIEPATKIWSPNSNVVAHTNYSSRRSCVHSKRSLHRILACEVTMRSSLHYKGCRARASDPMDCREAAIRCCALRVRHRGYVQRFSVAGLTPFRPSLVYSDPGRCQARHMNSSRCPHVPWMRTCIASGRGAAPPRRIDGATVDSLKNSLWKFSTVEGSVHAQYSVSARQKNMAGSV